MDVSPPLAQSPHDPTEVIVPRSVQAYLARLGDEQAQFLAALADANRSVHPSHGQVAKLVCLQLRLTQEFLDAQRAILKRRAQTDATVAAIATDAAIAADALVAEARTRTEIVGDASNPEGPSADDRPVPTDSAIGPAPATAALTASTPFEVDEVGANGELDHDVLAELIDGAFEPSEPDGVAARRDLRELLDGWWRVENQEATAAIDDANARAAMHLHLARVEVNELESLAMPSPGAEPGDLYLHRPMSALSTPLVAALDATDHEHLDDVLLHLLDALEPAAPVEPVSQPADSSEGLSVFIDPPRLPALLATDSLNDSSAAPQEAFDRFWGAFSPGVGRTWVFPQLLLPAVAVVGALVAVLAVVG